MLRPIVDGKRQCATCSEWLPIKLFCPKPNRYNRKQRETRCDPCRKLGMVAHLHGVPVETLRQMKAAAGRCEICECTLDLHLDHCHRTGRLRGFLCGNCNAMLGRALDRTDILQAGIGYLERWEAKHRVTPITDEDDSRRDRMNAMYERNRQNRLSKTSRRRAAI